MAGAPPPVATNGVAYATNYDSLATALTSDGTVSWSMTRELNSGVAIVDGALLLAAGHRIHAFDAASGDHMWGAQFDTNVAAESPPNGAGGLICVGTSLGVVALDSASGERRWQYRTGLETTATPAVVDGTVYVGSADTYVYAFDAETGAVQWRFKTGGQVQCAPAVVDGTVYVGSDDQYVYALNAADGAVEWRRKTPGAVRTVAVTGGHVFASTETERQEPDVLVALQGDTGEVCWRQTALSTWQSLAVGLDYLYTPIQTGDNLSSATIGALETATGELVWQLPRQAASSTSSRQRFYSGPAVMGNALYVSGLCDGICVARLVEA